MTTPLDPATLRTVARDLDDESQQEAQHALHCSCGNNVIHAARVGLLDDGNPALPDFTGGGGSI